MLELKKSYDGKYDDLEDEMTMKKRLLSVGLIAALGITSVLMMTGCGDKTPYSDYDLSEYVKVGNYKGLEYEKTEITVSEDEIQEEIQNRCEKNAEKKTVKEGTTKDGDTINISYEGKIDGKTFSGGSSEDDQLTLGSGRMIEGFEAGLVGKSVGDTVTLNLKFPEDYKKDLAGKDVTFEVKIKTKQVEEVPEYNLDFVKKYSDYDNFEDYEASVKKDLFERKTLNADVAVKNGLWEQIIKKSKALAYPEEKDAKIEEKMNGYKDAAKSYGVEWQDYLDTVGTTEEELKEVATKYAEEIVLQEMVLYAIAEEEGIEVSDEEYQKFLDDMLKQSGVDAEAFKSSIGMTIEEYAQQKGFRTSLLLDKVLDKVMEYGKEVSK